MFVESYRMHAHSFCIHMLLQLVITLKPEIQMKNREIPILANENIFPMKYGGASDMFCGVRGTCLKL